MRVAARQVPVGAYRPVQSRECAARTVSRHVPERQFMRVSSCTPLGSQGGWVGDARLDLGHDVTQWAACRRRVSQSCGVSGQPVRVRAAELVPVARAGGDDVGVAVIGMVKPAHLGRRDDDAACHVVGDQAQEPGQFLAVQAGGGRPQVRPGFLGRDAAVGQDAGSVGRGGQRPGKFPRHAVPGGGHRTTRPSRPQARVTDRRPRGT
jgi:hypothetical protein